MVITNENLIDWLKKQAIWIKDAVLTFYENGEFSDKDIKRFAKECIDEANGKKKNINVESLNLLTKDNRKSFSIKSINNILGVNALASDKKLSMGTTGITVIYGENGAGKSGYIRILKKLADAKYKDELKHNVYMSKKEHQSCEVVIASEQDEQLLECDLSKDGQYPILKDIDIFDTRIAKAYVEAAKEASFEPWIFTLFTEIARTAVLVKAEIEKMLDGYEKFTILIPEEIKNTEKVKKIASISKDSVFEEDDFKWTDEDDELLDKKNKESNVEAIKIRVSQLSNEITQVEALVEYFSQFVTFFSEDNVKKLNEAKKMWEDAAEILKAAEVLFGDDATELDKKSISNKAWISLWKNADEYYKAILADEGIAKYTEKNGVCPLCGQNIKDDKCLHRVICIDKYINGNASQETQNKKNAYFTQLKKCSKCWDDEQILLIVEAAGIEAVRDKIVECARKIATISTQINSPDIDKVEITHLKVDDIVKKLDELLAQKKLIRKQLMDLLQDEDHISLVGEITELKAQKWISENKDIIRNRIEYLKKAENYNKAGKLTLSNKLTMKSKELAGEILTDEYINRFNNELKILTRGTVKAVLKQQKATKGKIPFKVALENTVDTTVSPSEVLSEGENRVVALAAFFAEASGRNVQCPLVVDDPISSLDYKYEAAVVRRLVKAAEHRQVIVFTHRLSMVVGLQDECGKGVPFLAKELMGRGKIKGVPTESTVNAGKSLQKLNALKNENIPRLKKLDENSGEYTEGIHYICQQIRIHVEKSVEDTLLNGVVVRYRKSIQTLNKIEWLAEITSDDCKIIDEMMTKYSYYDHSMSDEAPLQEFTLEEIEDDVEQLITWLNDILSRKNKKR